MHPGNETSMHYFSCSGGPGAVSTKSVSGPVTLNLCFSFWIDLRATLCIPVHPGCETSIHYFSFSCGPGAVSIKSAATRYAELMFLYLMGPVGHVVHYGASKP
jgi:hypothetical protein